MFLVPTQQQPHTFVDHRASLHSSPSTSTSNTHHSKLGSEVTVDALLSSPISMERSAPEYSQSGLPSPYPSNFGDTNSEGSTADHASAAQYPVKQEANYSTSGTPTSEYGVYPQSARSGSFPDHIQRSYHPASTPSSGGGMAQQQNSPSMPQQDGRNHQAHAVKSDNDVPIDPSIAAPSPTYASYGQQSPYAPAPDMTHSYSHPSSGMYAQPRPDWTGYGHHGGAPLTPGHPVYAQNPASAPPPARPNQVYSFVPIPGAQQHKRPRRRYEEIERMYKCGWNGCEKAYGTLNHLNAHVTMQSHGQKRTPEEFKEIRKEWKQRKKEEEAARKAEEERQRVAAAASVQNGGPDPQGPDGTPTSTYPGSRPVQLPPIGYQPAQYPPPPTASVPQQPLPDYNNHMYSNYQPHSPYAQPSQGISYQSNGGQPPSH